MLQLVFPDRTVEGFGGRQSPEAVRQSQVLSFQDMPSGQDQRLEQELVELPDELVVLASQRQEV